MLLLATSAKPIDHNIENNPTKSHMNWRRGSHWNPENLVEYSATNPKIDDLSLYLEEEAIETHKTSLSILPQIQRLTTFLSS